MWRTAGVAAVLVVAALFSAWQHFELLRYGYLVEQLQRSLAAEDETRRHLRLEIETLKSPARIERLATTRLHMVLPGPDATTVVERVVPAEAPPRSVVARR
jgi:cell division protein FtsL